MSIDEREGNVPETSGVRVDIVEIQGEPHVGLSFQNGPCVAMSALAAAQISNAMAHASAAVLRLEQEKAAEAKPGILGPDGSRLQ